MLSGARIQHRFVEHIPSTLEEGVLYVSIPFATAIHRCACGCGNQVVTPLSPVDWRLIFDGQTASLQPSIGNWNFPCKSHYWITRNTVRWAPRLSRKEIEAGRKLGRPAKRQSVGGKNAPLVEEPETPADPLTPHGRRSVWQRLWWRLSSGK